jgi:hypothetical protein
LNLFVDTGAKQKMTNQNDLPKLPDSSPHGRLQSRPELQMPAVQRGVCQGKIQTEANYEVQLLL